MWRIIALDKDGREVARLEIATGELTIGRDQDRQIQLPSASVSRRHARLMVSGGQLLIVDEGSANGVSVNGTRVTSAMPVDGLSRIEISEFRIVVEPHGAPMMGDPPTPAVSPMATSLVTESIRLVAQGGPFDGRVFPVIGECTVGRATENQIVLDDPSLSRKHAQLRGQGRRLDVADLGSSNGTFVNGRKVGRATATPGDTVRFGELSFRIEDERGQGRAGGELTSGLMIALLGSGALTLVIVLVAGVVLVRRPTAVAAPAKDAIARISRQAEQHLKLGKQLFNDKKWSDAKIELDATIESDPANTEARRLKALATRAPEDERNLASAASALAIGDRRGLETAMRLRDELLVGTAARNSLEAKLVPRLLQFGLARFDERNFVDAEWALCRAFEVNSVQARADARAGHDIHDAEKKLAHERGSQPCRAAR
ncbi:MAG: FHA domain-containing protein [Polyangia bacterium]